MNKKFWKILALVAALALIMGLGWFANAFLGNPLSKALATHTAQNHLSQTYGDTDFYIERITYSFKDGSYHAFIKSPSSVDCQFSFTLDMLGQLRLDTYEDVLDKVYTARRVDQEYRELTDTVIESPSFPYPDGICYGRLEIYPREAMEDPEVTDVPAYAIVQEELVLDKIYDIPQLGARVGKLIIYIDSDTVSVEEACRVMLEVRALFDEAGIPFAAMDFMLEYPLSEDGEQRDEVIWVKDFLYEDIYEEDMVERVLQADQARQAYYENIEK